MLTHRQCTNLFRENKQGGYFLKKLWCCVGGEVKYKNFGCINWVDKVNWPLQWDWIGGEYLGKSWVNLPVHVYEKISLELLACLFKSIGKYGWTAFTWLEKSLVEWLHFYTFRCTLIYLIGKALVDIMHQLYSLIMDEKVFRTTLYIIGHLHDGIIWLQLPESFSLFFSDAN